MLIADVSDYLKTVIETEGYLFLRATDIEANIEVDNVDVSNNIVVILNNLPEVGHEISISGAARSQWPVELQFLKLAQLDHKEDESDTLRSDCQDAAYRIIAKLDPEIFAEYPTTYTINFLTQTKIYDKILTGCVVNVDLLYEVPIYSCGVIKISHIRLLETFEKKIRFLEH